MTRVGIIGLGFMGRMHYRCWRALAGAHVAAVCDANPRALETAGGAKGNVEGAADRLDLSGVQVFADAERMFAEARLDAVSITVPTHLHAGLAEKALRAGVHVLCEKPMALTLADCDAMIRAARETGRYLMVAHCIRFWPEYVAARDLVHGGAYGRVIAASFRRLSAPPTWAPENWFADEARSGGIILDLHIHDTDYIQHLFGVPRAVCTHGEPGYVFTRYDLGDAQVVTAEGCWRMPASFGFEMSFHLILERAAVVFDSRRSPALTVYPHDGAAFTPAVAAGDGYEAEIRHFLAWVRGERVAAVVTAEQARDAIRIGLAERESLRRRQKITLEAG